MMAKPKYLTGALDWFKIYGGPILNEPFKQVPIAVKGIWLVILCMGSKSQHETLSGNRIIQISDGVGLSDKQFCDVINCAMDEWLYAKEILSKRNSIDVGPHNEIIIKNWDQYQAKSKYDHSRETQLKYKHKLAEAGYKNMSEAFSSKVATLTKRKPTTDDLVAYMRFLPEYMHDNLRNAMDALYPGDHDFAEAKKIYEEKKNENLQAT